MVRTSDLDKEFYRPGEVAQMLGVHTRTVQRYDNIGELKFERLSTGRRRISRENLIRYLQSKDLLLDDEKETLYDIIYARVTSEEEARNGSLDKQVLEIVEKAPHLQDPLILKEVGSGMEVGREKLLEMTDRVMRGEVRNVYITQNDRLSRFEGDYLKRVFSHFGTKIIEVNEERKEIPEQESIDDLIYLMNRFSMDFSHLMGIKEKENLS